MTSADEHDVNECCWENVSVTSANEHDENECCWRNVSMMTVHVRHSQRLWLRLPAWQVLDAGLRTCHGLMPLSASHSVRGVDCWKNVRMMMPLGASHSFSACKVLDAGLILCLQGVGCGADCWTKV
eukprot:1159662-Pelagomonas_calceolata.AAC.14